MGGAVGHPEAAGAGPGPGRMRPVTLAEGLPGLLPARLAAGGAG